MTDRDFPSGRQASRGLTIAAIAAYTCPKLVRAVWSGCAVRE